MKASKKAVEPAIGIIGGSGLYNIDGLKKVREMRVRTPFGRPRMRFCSAPSTVCALRFFRAMAAGIDPAQSINYRANIYALKSVGVTQIISVSAVGSMKETIKPGTWCCLINLSISPNAGSRPFLRKVSSRMWPWAIRSVRSSSRALTAPRGPVGATVHEGGTYVCMEGPQFSTKRGESLLYRQWGVDVIGMTNMPEAKLAREAELCYATLAPRH